MAKKPNFAEDFDNLGEIQNRLKGFVNDEESSVDARNESTTVEHQRPTAGSTKPASLGERTLTTEWPVEALSRLDRAIHYQAMNGKASTTKKAITLEAFNDWWERHRYAEWDEKFRG